MIKYPAKITNLIDSFTRLPGIGRKTAEKLVFFLLKQKSTELESFAKNIFDLRDNNFLCPECFNFSESTSLCPICSNANRDKTKLCVIEEIHDLTVLENTGIYRGLYHVLGGKLDPVEGMTADRLTIQQLLNRIHQNKVEEVILALNPDLQGEGTILYLKKILQPFNVRVTLLARGLPMGADIEYADEATLTNAMRGRLEV